MLNINDKDRMTNIWVREREGGKRERERERERERGRERDRERERERGGGERNIISDLRKKNWFWLHHTNRFNNDRWLYIVWLSL